VAFVLGALGMKVACNEELSKATHSGNPTHPELVAVHRPRHRIRTIPRPYRCNRVEEFRHFYQI